MHNGHMKEDEFSVSAKRAWRSLAACLSRLRQCSALIVVLMILFAGPTAAYAAPVSQSVKLAKTAVPLVKKAGPFAAPVAIVLVVIGVAGALIEKMGKKRKRPKYSRVGIGVVAPEEVKRNEDLMVQVVGNVEELLDRTIEEAVSVDAINHAKVRGRCSFPAKLNDVITFKLQISGIEFEEDKQSVVWEERDFKVQFLAHVPKTAEVGSHAGKLLIFIADIVVGRIGFTTRVNRLFKPSQKPAKTNEKVFKNYFISYSSKDLDKVASRVQGMRISDREFAKHSFWDKMFLTPGDRYEKEIYDYIDNKADVFLLFWSSNAAASEWVRKEIKRAVARQKRMRRPENRLPEIVPVPIENPIPPPPEELSDLHFGDAVNSLGR